MAVPVGSELRQTPDFVRPDGAERQRGGRDLLQHAKPHWAAFEVSEALQPGPNLLAVRVPKGVLARQVKIDGQYEDEVFMELLL